MKSYGMCPASCGEFVQGIIDDEEYLCSYAIDMYSKVYIEEKLIDINLGRRKSRLAIEKVFEKFNLPKKYTKNISLNIDSKIPVGKGMASSTADIGATIKATLSLIDKDLSSEEICKLAAEIEPTDSIFIDKNSIFNPLSGTVIKYLGNLTNAKVIILEPNKMLDTMKIRLRKDYNTLKIENREIIKRSFAILEEGLKSDNLSLVGEACTLSSLANENIEKKEYLSEIIKISKKCGAYGVNIAHSGTVIGILIDKFMDDKKIIDVLCESNIDSVYNKIYTLNIINGGIKGEIECNT
ncbi:MULTISPECIES: cobalamin biosynthesis protein [Clostridioides]|uniref:GHMP family kinase ATP-binding protein n=1 Tax=Clostridioides sp. ZZV14-6387 TaxID=2811497 RepID=UPI000940FDAB|nr:cobalamin biosynthesis protein [Clostridioides sp. ZZV14-6387]MCI9977851.1 cobalamin biosynthesis protein [Clostridioides difficile]MDB3083179.1 cobalamin biosynthesis protein [Clostridioides difficile]MDI0267469.1 cobalamin biosynthesis protein [Clostridioides difficile]NJI81247.1 cobalamin biosynthesis protein [Clostridioides difficile]